MAHDVPLSSPGRQSCPERLSQETVHTLCRELEARLDDLQLMELDQLEDLLQRYLKVRKKEKLFIRYY